MNFKQPFVNYQNILDFYCFVKTYKHDLIEDYQQKVKLFLRLKRNFLVNNIDIWSKTREVFKIEYV